MPSPSKITRDAIVGAAETIIEAGSIEALTMQAVAERIGVRAPSLYKHMRDRAALLQAVEGSVLARLRDALDATRDEPDDRAALRAMAAAYRAFANARPASYALLFRPDQAVDEAGVAARGAAVAPVLLRLTRLTGAPDKALARARVMTAFLHGFVMMEAAGAFHLGGRVEDAFADALDVMIGGPRTQS